MPIPLKDDIQARVKDLSLLLANLNSLPTAVLGCLIAGFLLFIILLLLSYCVAYRYPTRFASIVQNISTRKQTMFHFGVGLLYCVPYILLVVVQHSVTRTIEQLPT